MKKFMSLALVCTILFSMMSVGVSANTTVSMDNSFATASFSTFSDVAGYDYIEVATLGNGSTVTFKHFTNDVNGRSAVEVTEANGVVTLVELDPNTYDIYLDGEKVNVVTTYPAGGVSPAGTSVGWHESAGGPVEQNYEMINFTVATLAAAIAKFTKGPVSGIASAVAFLFGRTDWCSAKKWVYLNYTDYNYKVGSYIHAEVYDAANCSGKMVYQYTTPVTVR